jgi:hypothetical protein
MDPTMIIKEVQNHNLGCRCPPNSTPPCATSSHSVGIEIIRRFETEKIVFNGTNREECLLDIHKTAMSGELLI